MLLTPIQAILLTILGILILRTIRKLREGLIRPPVVLGWLGLWTLGALAVLFPDSTGRIADTFGVGRGVDVVVYLAIALLFYLQFRAYNRTVAMEKQITLLVQRLALMEDEERNDRSS